MGLFLGYSLREWVLGLIDSEMVRYSGSGIVIGVILTLAGVLSHMTTADAFEKLTNFEFGLTTKAKIVAINEISSFGRNRQQVTFEYKDQEGVTRRSLLEATGFRWYVLNEKYTVSYQPGHYDYVRRQKARMPVELHNRWLLMFKVLTLAGLIVLAMPFLKRKNS